MKTKRVLAIAASLALVLAGCGSDIVEYEVSSATIDRFAANADKIGARDYIKAPLAMSVLASNQIGVPEGVQIWNPEEALRSAGINNGDLIALVDGQVPSREYRSSFAANQRPFGNATEQYVHFVSGLFELRKSQESVLLTVYPRYATRAEREKYGGVHAKDPKLIRVIFR
jgi:hypothetical protein